MNQSPNADRVHSLLAQASGLLQQKRYSKARKLCEEALRMAPGSADAHMLLAGVHEGRGNVAAAVNEYRRATELSPNHLASWVNLGVCYKENVSLWDALGAFQRACEIDSSSLVARYNLARVLYDLGMLREAIPHFEFVLAQRPGWPEVQGNLASAYMGGGDMDKGVALYQDALRKNPNMPFALTELAFASLAKGEFDAGKRQLEQALELDPEFAPAHVQLSEFDHPGEDERLALIEAVLQRRDLSTGNRWKLMVAAFRILNRRQRYDEAFAQLSEANRLRYQLYPFTTGGFTRSDAEALLKLANDTFTPQFFDARAGWGLDTDTPVFVVGMPRSGTTLVEQIISSHPLAAGAGELNTILALFKTASKELKRDIDLLRDPANLSGEEAARLARRYLESYPKEVAAARPERIVDKATLNIFFVGFIKLLFPRARIIVCRRERMDNCWSCYLSSFALGSLPYTNDIEQLAWMYARTGELTERWCELFPGDVLVTDYETLVSDFEPQARRLIDFVGLEWDDACLAFHEHERIITTASLEQVRKPIYTSSVGRWKAYEAHLQPLQDALDAEMAAGSPAPVR